MRAVRAVQIKRTEGVSTTDIVGRMLTCTRANPHMTKEVDSQVGPAYVASWGGVSCRPGLRHANSGGIMGCTAVSFCIPAQSRQSQLLTLLVGVVCGMQYHPLTRSFSQGSRNAPTGSGERVLSPQSSFNSNREAAAEDAEQQQPQTPRDLRVGEWHSNRLGARVGRVSGSECMASVIGPCIVRQWVSQMAPLLRAVNR